MPSRPEKPVEEGHFVTVIEQPIIEPSQKNHQRCSTSRFTSGVRGTSLSAALK
jgi:hypothetical protein